MCSFAHKHAQSRRKLHLSPAAQLLVTIKHQLTALSLDVKVLERQTRRRRRRRRRRVRESSKNQVKEKGFFIMTVSLMKKQLGLIYLLAPRFQPPPPPLSKKNWVEEACTVPGGGPRRIGFGWGEPSQVKPCCGGCRARRGGGRSERRRRSLGHQSTLADRKTGTSVTGAANRKMQHTEPSYTHHEVV